MKIVARSIVLIIASIVAFSATAIEAPKPECHKIYVTHPRITITARALKENKIVPVSFNVTGDYEVNEKLTKKQNVYRLMELTGGWHYIEVRVTTKWETPLSTIPLGTRCVDIVWDWTND